MKPNPATLIVYRSGLSGDWWLRYNDSLADAYGPFTSRAAARREKRRRDDDLDNRSTREF